jgi:NAD(P)-dependent dehydrogenase (short-subunit alcohol dehydrogenase family)
MTAPLLFITGASSGIGQAMALEWARRGGRLALVARRPDEMRAWIAAQGWADDRAMVYEADARDIAAMTAAGRDCIARQGVPDVVIANAGISIGVDMSQEGDIEVLRRVVETNNIGMAATFQPFIAPMRERRASVAGIRGLPGHAAYSLSKAGVISFCESLRVELRPSGVRVVCLAPGYIDTPLTQGNTYSMPFLMPADKFAMQALDAIAAGVGLRVIPWQMGVLARLLRILPNWIYDRAVAGRPRKARQAQ